MGSQAKIEESEEKAICELRDRDRLIYNAKMLIEKKKSQELAGVPNENDADMSTQSSKTANGPSTVASGTNGARANDTVP